MTKARLRSGMLIALALLLACGEGTEQSGQEEQEGERAVSVGDDPPGIELELPDIWIPVGSGEEGALFEYAQARDVKLHVKVSREAGAAATPEVLLERLRARLEERPVRDRDARITPRGHVLLAWSQVVDTHGKRLFTRRWLLARPGGVDLVRADVSLGMPDLWEEQEATAKVIAQLQERLMQASLTSGGPGAGG